MIFLGTPFQSAWKNTYAFYNLLRKLLLSHLLTGKEKSRSSSSPALFLSRSELSPVTPPPASPLGDGPRRPPGLPAHRRRSGCSSWSITPPVHLVLTFPRPCPIRSPARALTCARLSNGASRLNKAVAAAAGGARSQGLRRGRVSPSMSRGSAVARDDHHRLVVHSSTSRGLAVARGDNNCLVVPSSVPKVVCSEGDAISTSSPPHDTTRAHGLPPDKSVVFWCVLVMKLGCWVVQIWAHASSRFSVIIVIRRLGGIDCTVLIAPSRGVCDIV
jgi:hypothetical protein